MCAAAGRLVALLSNVFMLIFFCADFNETRSELLCLRRVTMSTVSDYYEQLYDEDENF